MGAASGGRQRMHSGISWVPEFFTFGLDTLLHLLIVRNRTVLLQNFRNFVPLNF